jgi:hypothetical protein
VTNYLRGEIILNSDRKLPSDLRAEFVSDEAAFAEHNGDIWSRKTTKYGTNTAGKRGRFLLEDSIK